jgi:hypothetical protein
VHFEGVEKKSGQRVEEAKRERGVNMSVVRLIWVRSHRSGEVESS